MNKFNFDKNTSNYLVLIFMLIMGFLVTWKVFSAGGTILESAPKSKIFSAGNELK